MSFSFGSFGLLKSKTKKTEEKKESSPSTLYMPIRKVKDTKVEYLTDFNEVFLWGKSIHSSAGDIGGTYLCQTLQIGYGGSIVDFDHGVEHVVVLTEGDVRGYGDNEFGQLGGGEMEESDDGWVVLAEGCFNDVQCGMYHTVLLKNREVWTCGKNDFGQLGLGEEHKDVSFLDVPTKVDIGNVMEIFVRYNSCFALTENGGVYAWGDNLNGNLGLPNIGIIYNPTRIDFNEGTVLKISPGLHHTLFLVQRNNRFFVYSCGEGQQGQLGYATDDTVIYPREIHFFGNNIVDISTGVDHSIALSDTGTVFTWGRNNFGQLGKAGDPIVEPQVIPLPPALQISSGNYHSSAVCLEGIWTWGKGKFGQLGDEECRNSSVPYLIKYVNNTNIRLSLGYERTFGIRYSDKIKYYCDEIIRYEKYYLNILDIIVDLKNNIMKEIKNKSIFANKQDVELFFMNIEEIRDISRRLTCDLVTSKTPFEVLSGFIGNNMIDKITKYCCDCFHLFSFNYIKDVCEREPTLKNYLENFYVELSSKYWIIDQSLSKLLLYPFFQIENYYALLKNMASLFTEADIEFNIFSTIFSLVNKSVLFLHNEFKLAINTSKFQEIYKGYKFFSSYEVRLVYSGHDRIFIKGFKSKHEIFIFRKFFFILVNGKKGKLSTIIIPISSSWIENDDKQLKVKTPEESIVLSFKQSDEKEIVLSILLDLFIFEFGGDEKSTIESFDTRFTAFKFSPNHHGYPGAKYEGDWKNGKMHGSGVLEFSNGSTYSGSWREGRTHGEGTFENKTNGTFYVGEWIRGYEEGFGKKDYNGAGSYNGYWKKGKKDGFGIHTLDNGEYKKYIGQWINDEREGFGICVYSDGNIYIGSWLKNERNGAGTLIFGNDDIYEGHWLEDALHNEGIISYTNQQYIFNDYHKQTKLDKYFSKLKPVNIPHLYLLNGETTNHNGYFNVLNFKINGNFSFNEYSVVNVNSGNIDIGKKRNRIDYDFHTPNTIGHEILNNDDWKIFFSEKLTQQGDYQINTTNEICDDIGTLIEENGFLRSFLNEGSALIKELLESVKNRGSLHGFIHCKIIQDIKYFSYTFYKSIQSMLPPNDVVRYGDVLEGMVSKYLIEEFYEITWRSYSLYFAYLSEVLKKKLSLLQKLDNESLFKILKIDEDFWLHDLEDPYYDAVEELKTLSSVRNPPGKISLLKKISQTLSRTVDNYHSEKSVLLSGDELFPIFTFITIRANLESLHNECAFIKDFSNDIDIFGMEGLLLKTLEAVLVHLMTYDWKSHFDYQVSTNL
eukprot:TRINITY_DN12870_c0_g1_i1.p1 TRINITY_DN12870_c0_g1~~TRINITY_DN12870_c0_g1_i1.p1  ORF type:complete len:1280 (+),score=255.98 TRINITY_DN12870_c0_g1_i1:118-3957(+)